MPKALLHTGRLFLPVTGMLTAFAPNLTAQVGQSTFLPATAVRLTTASSCFAKPNKLTKFSNVTGFMQRPGRYEISNSIGLVNLRVLPGGAASAGVTGSRKITCLSEMHGRSERKG